MNLLSSTVKNNSKSSFVDMRGLNGLFYSDFGAGKKIYVLKVSQVVCDELRKVDFKFNKKGLAQHPNFVEEWLAETIREQFENNPI